MANLLVSQASETEQGLSLLREAEGCSVIPAGSAFSETASAVQCCQSLPPLPVPPCPQDVLLV